jgi:hypothetical protein
MKLTARSNRTVRGEGSDIHLSPLFTTSEKNKNEGESLYNFDDKGRDSTIESENDASVKRRHSSGSTYLRRFIIRWRLSKFSFKLAFAVSSFSILLVVFIRIWDQFFYQIDGFGENHSSSSSSHSFAVVVNTFRRPERLQQTVRHYAETCGSRYNVGQIFVVWADPKTDPPPSGEFFFDGSPLSLSLRGKTNGTVVTDHVPVEILIKSKDSLNARFEPIPQLRTTSIFMVDDDIRVACSSLQMAFQAWLKHPDSMVGYYPRLATAPASSWMTTRTPTQQQEQQLIYHAWPMVYWRQKFNIVLTKASFLHSKYLELYTNDASFPREIKDHVDRYRNCEDIAMSMLVANYTKQNNADNDDGLDSKKARAGRPFYVEGSVSDVGLFGGISSGTGHFATRSDCLTQLTDIFRAKGWGSPLEVEFDLVANSWVKHAPGFWWQSSPSNVFEWFGLANILS